MKDLRTPAWTVTRLPDQMKLTKEHIGKRVKLPGWKSNGGIVIGIDADGNAWIKCEGDILGAIYYYEDTWELVEEREKPSNWIWKFARDVDKDESPTAFENGIMTFLDKLQDEGKI